MRFGAGDGHSGQFLLNLARRDIPMTRHVPISEFKDHASELVAAVERGEEIVITRHGKPAARVVGMPSENAERRARVKQAFDALAKVRAEQRARGSSSTIEEMIAWKNEGRK
jgi:prevent-host-death family protein